MADFLLLKDEIISNRLGSISLTNKRIIQVSGSGENFRIASIPLRHVSSTICKSSIKSWYLQLMIVPFLAFLYLNNQRYDYLYQCAPLLLIPYLYYRYIGSKKSLLYIYSTGSSYIAENVSSYSNKLLKQFTNSIDEKVASYHDEQL